MIVSFYKNIVVLLKFGFYHERWGNPYGRAGMIWQTHRQKLSLRQLGNTHGEVLISLGISEW